MPSLRSTPRVIGVVGSRRRDSEADFVACWEAFDAVYRPGDRVVSGGCLRGGDRFAKIIAKRRGLTITVHYPDWDGVGRGAGFVRNTKIAEDCDVLIALVAADRTGGTEDTVKKATKMGKRVIFV